MSGLSFILANVAAMGGAEQGFGFRDAVMTLQTLGLMWLGWRERKIAGLETGIRKSARALAKAEIDGVSGELRLLVEGLRAEMRRVTERLDRSDEAMLDQVRDEGQQDVRREREMRQFSEFVRDNCASKRDVELLSNRFDGLQQAVARAMAERLTAPTEKGLVNK